MDVLVMVQLKWFHVKRMIGYTLQGLTAELNGDTCDAVMEATWTLLVSLTTRVRGPNRSLGAFLQHHLLPVS